MRNSRIRIVPDRSYGLIITPLEHKRNPDSSLTIQIISCLSSAESLLPAVHVQVLTIADLAVTVEVEAVERSLARTLGIFWNIFFRNR